MEILPSQQSTDLTVSPSSAVADTTNKYDFLWPEPLDTPGFVPRHLKRAATGQFPILEVIQRILYRLKPSGGDLEKLLALIGLYQAIRPAYSHLKNLCIWALTVQVTIPENDPIAKEVLAWMGSEVILKSHTRNAMLVTGGSQDANDDFHRRMMMGRASVMGAEKLDGEVLALPPIGTRLFWIGFRPFIFSRRGGHSYRNNSVLAGNMVDDSGQLQNSLSIMTLGWSMEPLRGFTDLCHEFKIKNLTGTTTVYFAGDARADVYGVGNGWQSVSKAIRKLDTIDMDETIKLDLVKDAEYYYSEQSRSFFADCGIPYRRGYLFYGPPGTGKSSFSAALAGHLGCDIYHINLATGNITDGALHRLFLGLPRKCIVVIEDIDSAGIGREHTSSTPAPPTTHPHLQDMLGDMGGMSIPGSQQPPAQPPHPRRNMVTLSGLLNAIDGNASQEGRLLIMTSNNPNALDPALTRPGRIDKKIFFGNMSTNAARSIFKRLIGRSALAHDAAFTMEQIEQWANEFAAKVPANTFTPAQVQNFLQGCRADHLKALSDIDSWVEKTRVDDGASASDTTRTSDTSASFIDPVDMPPELGNESDLDSLVGKAMD